MATLSGKDIVDLSKLLATALDVEDLEMLVLSSTGEDLYVSFVGQGKPLVKTIFDLLRELEREGIVDKFLAEVYQSLPNKPEVRKAVASLVPQAATPPRNDAVALSVQKDGAVVANEPTNAFAPGLQRNVKPHLKQLDLHIWLKKLAEIERQVCRIEFNGNAAGTGFLVGPDLVLTNWHVVVAANAANQLNQLACRFDYQRLENGTRQQGTAVTLHTDGCIASSPYSPAELTQNPETPLPTADQLDYALLRLAKPVGLEEKRGWVDMTKGSATLKKGDALLIVQHPDGAPMKLALDTDSIIKYNDNNTRLRYATNTEAGSSGSPCFNMDWELVALHHFGDPTWTTVPQYNQGIPIALIRERIIAGGKVDLQVPLDAAPTGPETIVQKPGNPERKKLIEDFESTIGRVDTDFKYITVYKNLHDSLHQLQVKPYFELRNAAAGFAKNVHQARILNFYRNDVSNTLTLARASLQDFPADDGGRALERNWIDDLDKRSADYNQAVDKRDGPSANNALFEINQILSDVPSRLNQQIFIKASYLPLPALATAIDAVGAFVGVDTNLIDRAKKSITELGLNISTKVGQHKAWQDTDRVIPMLDDVFDREGNEILIRFRQYWPTLKTRVNALMNEEPGAIWVKHCAAYTDDIEDQLAKKEFSVDLQLAYETLRGATRAQFFAVDSNLKMECANLSRKDAPWLSLLEWVAHE